MLFQESEREAGYEFLANTHIPAECFLRIRVCFLAKSEVEYDYGEKTNVVMTRRVGVRDRYSETLDFVTVAKFGPFNRW